MKVKVVSKVIILMFILLFFTSCLSRARDYEYKLMSYLPWTEAYSERVGFNEYAKNAGGKVVHGNPEPEMPDMEKNNNTLLGVDSDSDGLRDDVEIFINYMMRDESYNQVMAMRMMAKNYGKILKFHGHSRVKKLIKRKTDDYICFGAFYEGMGKEYEESKSMHKRLTMKFFNTEKRREAKHASQKKAGTYTKTWKLGDEAKKLCRFNIKRSEI